MKINITIPTYNRADCLEQAIRSALDQVWPEFTVTVVDDGSTDNTREVVQRWLKDPRLTYVRLARNGGTAAAKNVSLLLSPFDAITFHDSDDIAHQDKLLLQSRGLNLRGMADELLDWAALGHEPGSELRVDAAVGAHRFIKLDGSVHVIDKRISLMDDFFPTVQSPSKTEGDWVLINSGLFRRNCFQRLGGYLDSVEEDRELRNRFLAAGIIFHFIHEPLLTKVEMASSLTTDGETGYRGEKRRKDREEVWRRNQLYRNGCWGPQVDEQARVAVDLKHVEIAEIVNGEYLRVNDDIHATSGTVARFREMLRVLLKKTRSQSRRIAASAPTRGMQRVPDPMRRNGVGRKARPGEESENGGSHAHSLH